MCILNIVRYQVSVFDKHLNSIQETLTSSCIQVLSELQAALEN
jgi:hypothetical protein